MCPTIKHRSELFPWLPLRLNRLGRRQLVGKVNCFFIGLAIFCSSFVLYLNYTLFCCFFIAFQKVNCVFWWTCLPPLQQRARGKKCHRGIEHWATLGNSGQAGKYQHNGEEQTIDSTPRGTNNGEKTAMCKDHTCHRWS